MSSALKGVSRAGLGISFGCLSHASGKRRSGHAGWTRNRLEGLAGVA